MNYLKKTALLTGLACIIAAPGMASAKDKMVEASNILYSNVSNGLNVFGKVDNVMLDKHGKSVEFILFDTSTSFDATDAGKGFVNFKNVNFNPETLGNFQVVIADTNAQRKPQELKVTRTEAEYRLLSRILEESIQFSDMSLREVNDVLIDAKTGHIKYFTVEMDTDNVFGNEIRAIPAETIEINWSGKVMSSLSLAEVDKNEKYKISSM